MNNAQLGVNKRKGRQKGKYEYKKKILQQKINKYTKLFSKNINETIFIDYNTNSWFNLKIYKQPQQLFNKPKVDYKTLSHDGYYTKQYNLTPTVDQKIILREWLRDYTLMYNATTEYLRTEWFKYKILSNIGKVKKLKKNKKLKYPRKKLKITFSLNIKIVKGKLQKEKEKIIEGSIITSNKKSIKVDSHLLDYAINDALNRYKSCLTNKQRGNIGSFRLRNLKINRNNQILKLEKLAFNDSGFSTSKIGNMKINCANFNYKNNIHTVATLHYIKKTDTFRLLVKYKKKEINTKKTPENIIALDPGIRTCFTGYAQNEIIEIGTNIYQKIKIKLEYIDKIKNAKKSNYKPSIKNVKERPRIELSEKLKNKIIEKQRKRITNLINDYHWKTINYLTDTYSGILIGNFSTKSMGETKTVSKMVKRVGNSLRLNQFHERLKYRCTYTKTKYNNVDEAYTSKCCCKCGTYNKNLGSAKRYICINPSCNLNIGRDINGGIGIMISSLPI